MGDFARLTRFFGILLPLLGPAHMAKAQVNSVQVGDQTLPAVQVNGKNLMAFQQSGSEVLAYNEKGSLVWKTSIADLQSVQSGFDFNSDGYPDVATISATATQQSCGAQLIKHSKLQILSGLSGQALYNTGDLLDKCWSFPTATYPTQQWTSQSILFGATSGQAVILPYYATQGFWLRQSSNKLDSGYLIYPSTSQFGSYSASKNSTIESAKNQKFIANSHVANGLVTNFNGTPSVLFFTSGRVVEYSLTPYSSSQLLYDIPYISKTGLNLAGRNYGLVAVDPENAANVALLSGTSVNSIYQDQLQSKMTADPVAGIERHVSLLNRNSKKVLDRFYSVAHAATDAGAYNGRVVFPARPFVKTGRGTSRLAYNVYEGGHWVVHFTSIGNLQDQILMRDWFLWDIVEHQGQQVWVLTPSRYATDPDVPGYYFLKWKTQLATWNEGTQKLNFFKTFDGQLPHIQAHSRMGQVSSSEGYLYPVQLTQTSSGVRMPLIDASKKIQLLELEPK